MSDKAGGPKANSDWALLPWALVMWCAGIGLVVSDRVLEGYAGDVGALLCSAIGACAFVGFLWRAWVRIHRQAGVDST